MFKLKVIALSVLVGATNAHAFGVDMCFNDATYTTNIIQNCINIEETCRTDNLDLAHQLSCRALALNASLSGLSGSNSIIGARNSVHSDSTYLMAQLIGFTPWQAYQMMIYSEATDQSVYTPFNQKGEQMLTSSQISYCQNNWGPNMPNQCLIITKVMNGIYKFNAYTGGMLLHLHSRYSANGIEPPVIAYPTDFFAPINKPYEALLSNMHNWVFGVRSDACAGGIMQTMGSDTSPCASSANTLQSPVNFFAAGFSKFAIPFVTLLGELTINADNTGTTYASDTSFQSFATPHDYRYAKMGIFLHVLGDRYSHHMCSDNSYFFPQAGGNYNSYYSNIFCAQGSHFLWHGWEQGTQQTDANLKTQYQTIRPSLDYTFDQLVQFATLNGIQLKPVDKATLINNLVNVIQVFDPRTRLNNMVSLMESYGALPLPGNGAAANYSIDQWLINAGAPVHLKAAPLPA